MALSRTRPVFSWCFEPACQSGLDIAAYPKLSPPTGGEHAEQIAHPLDVFRGRAARSLPMDTLYPCCAGLDVHKDTVVACVRRVDARGKVRQQTRTFGAMTAQLLELADWLAEEGATHTAMESTGVYWKPIWNILEGR